MSGGVIRQPLLLLLFRLPQAEREGAAAKRAIVDSPIIVAMRRSGPDEILGVQVIYDSPIINAMFGAKIKRPASQWRPPAGHNRTLSFAFYLSSLNPILMVT